MQEPAKIRKLDEVVVNRIAAGEIIQRPANALKELIENSLDAKSTDIQITVKEGGLKLLQIQDNGTGIRKEDMEIVCERFTTSKLQQFDDLKSIATFGFRGEALASISHVALLTITTKTAQEKCGYKASYIDSKLKAPPKMCAANQGTTILIENLFYNVATRRKALASASEEFAKIADVVTRYAIHNAGVSFTLKKYGEVIPQVRTPHNSTKINNVKILYGNPVAQELLEVETEDETYKFKLKALVTNPNYSSKRMTYLLFINQRLVDSSAVRRMLEALYSIYLQKKTYPWCYISLEINPSCVDVNVHPTKHEVRFLHEDAIIERVKDALDAKLSNNVAPQSFYLQTRLPEVGISKDLLKTVLPEDKKNNTEKKIHAREMIRTDHTNQKLDKFNFTLRTTERDSFGSPKGSNDPNRSSLNATKMEAQERGEIMRNEGDAGINACSIKSQSSKEVIVNIDDPTNVLQPERFVQQQSVSTKGAISPLHTPPIPANTNKKSHWSSLVDEPSSAESMEVFSEALGDIVTSTQIENPREQSIGRDFSRPPNAQDELSSEDPAKKTAVSDSPVRDMKTVYDEKINESGNESATSSAPNNDASENTAAIKMSSGDEASVSCDEIKTESSVKMKSYSVNNFRRAVKLRSILTLRKEIEDNYHMGLREIVSSMIFVGNVDEKSALIQSGLNLYICDTMKLTEELFYEIMLYDFSNYGALKFSEPLPLEELAMLGLENEESGWTEEDGSKEDIAANVKELLLEKADMLKEYFSIVIDKRGNLKSLPILIDKYFPCEAELPLYILRLSTEVDWTAERPCFEGICRETAKFYSHINTNGNNDWKHVVEHIIYRAIKDSLLPPKHFAHDTTILQIASLPNLYKVFERC